MRKTAKAAPEGRAPGAGTPGQRASRAGIARAGAALLAVLALASCAADDARNPGPLAPPDPAPPAAADPLAGLPPGEDEAAAARAAGAAPAPDPGTDPAAAREDRAFAAAYDAPQIYMALQPDAGGGPVSIVFAIDASRDDTPSDEPAIRLTPENGECNPQQLRYFNFPPGHAGRPVYGPDEAFRGVTARELPDFMAMAVTSEMLAAGLIEDPEESQPQNVCTRKLMQRLIINQSSGQG